MAEPRKPLIQIVGVHRAPPEAIFSGDVSPRVARQLFESENPNFRAGILRVEDLEQGDEEEGPVFVEADVTECEVCDAVAIGPPDGWRSGEDGGYFCPACQKTDEAPLASLQVVYTDVAENRVLTLGGSSYSLEEATRRLADLPACEQTDYVVDLMDPTGDIIGDHYVTAAAVETLLGKPIAELLATARQIAAES